MGESSGEDQFNPSTRISNVSGIIFGGSRASLGRGSLRLELCGSEVDFVSDWTQRHRQSDWIVPREAPVAIEGFPRSFGTVRACDEKKDQDRKCQRGSSCGSGMSGTGGGHEKEEYQVSAQNRTRAILKRIRLD